MNPSIRIQSSSKRIKAHFSLSYQLIFSKMVLMVLMILSFVTTIIAEDFGIPRRNVSVSFNIPTNSVANNSVSDVWIAANTAQPNSKIGSQVSSSSQVNSAVNPVPPEVSSNSMSMLPYVVRLVAFDKSGQSFGSGSYIGNYGEYGLILSNWHVVNDADGLVHVHFPNGFTSYGAVIQSDKKWDLTLIVVSKPPQSVPPLPIAQTTPKPGDQLWIAGHGSASYCLSGGQCVRYLAPEIPQDGSMPQYEIVEISVKARQGDSGGPILNARGELAGVLFGSDMVRNTAGSHCERVKSFLNQTRSLMTPLPQRPETYFASIEKGGPRRVLGESQNSAPTEQPKNLTPQRRADLAGSSMSFGARSNPRRYTQPAPPTSFSIFEKTAEKSNESGESNESGQRTPTFHDVPTFRTKAVEREPNPQGTSQSTPSTSIPLSLEAPTSYRVIRTVVRTEKPMMISPDKLVPLSYSSPISEKIGSRFSNPSVNPSTNSSIAKSVEPVIKTNDETREKMCDKRDAITVAEKVETISSVMYLLGFLTTSSLSVVAVRLLNS